MLHRARAAGIPVITEDGCWADFRITAQATEGRPCLFLDRDGVLIEDTGYPHRPAEIALIPESLRLVAEAHRAGWVTGIVSNQSGLARGFFGWDAFAAVQTVIDAALAQAGARLDFVLACPHHPDGVVAAYRAPHPWRKPAPGMLAHAMATLHLDRPRSIMLGDRETDMQAAAAAGVEGWLLVGADGPRPGPGSRRSVRRSDVERDLLAAMTAPEKA